MQVSRLVSAAAVAASATAAATAAVAASATATAAAAIATTATAAAVAATTTAARPRFTRLGFVDGQRPALEARPVHLSNGLIGPGLHLHEAEAAAAAGLAVHDHLRPGHSAVRLEGGTELVRCGPK